MSDRRAQYPQLSPELGPVQDPYADLWEEVFPWITVPPASLFSRYTHKRELILRIPVTNLTERGIVVVDTACPAFKSLVHGPRCRFLTQPPPTLQGSLQVFIGAQLKDDYAKEAFACLLSMLCGIPLYALNHGTKTKKGGKNCVFLWVGSQEEYHAVLSWSRRLRWCQGRYICVSMSPNQEEAEVVLEGLCFAKMDGVASVHVAPIQPVRKTIEAPRKELCFAAPSTQKVASGEGIAPHMKNW